MSNEQLTSPFRFAISATFTADPLRPTILFWGRRLHSDFEVGIAPYNQLLQTLLDPTSEFGQNIHGINIILARLEDFGQLEKIESNVVHLLQELRAAGSRLSSPVVFCLCPSSPSFHASEELETRLRTMIDRALQETAGVHCIDYRDIEHLYPVAAVHDPEGDRLGRIPYTDVYYCALGTMLVRYTHALMRSSFKVIALDCDNTLWQGICGEDGPEAVVLDPPRRGLHEFMLEQREDGMLLAMASKNNESDVMETFSAHPEMPLQPRHFVGWRLNWEPKPESLSELAQELGLGLESFIFIDDNPKECAEVEGAIPEALTLALPENIEETPHFLKHVWAFDHPVTTEEDRNRNVYYQQQQEFGAEVRRSGSLEDFLMTLDLKVSITPPRAGKLARIAQLTQRTNQFNLTSIRRSEADIQSLERTGYGLYTVDVSDRFGDYGTVGALIVKPEAADLQVDSFLLSCRALGRGVEHRMLAFLGQKAASLGLQEVLLRYVRTAKNLPAEQFLHSIDFGERETDSVETILRLPAGLAAAFKWKPTQVAAAPAGRPDRKATKPARRVDYGGIARSLASAENIRRQVSAERAPAGRVEDMSDVEGTLADIWSELLERGNISRNDNFFDLGGHSLLAVLLLLRIREIFGVELSIDDVYSGTLTLADLASRIETAQLGEIDPEEYAALLAEIDSMSDEQDRELLAREQAEQT